MAISILVTGIYQGLSLSAEMVERKDSPHLPVSNLKKRHALTRISCAKCHIRLAESEKEAFFTLNADYDKSCFVCHTQTPQSCRLIVIPKIYNIINIQIPDISLPLSLGRITCASCHWVHEKEGGEKREYNLREEYTLFKKQAEEIDPHKTGVFCFICHEKEPIEKGGPLHLKYNGDTIRICKECHDNKRARADNHPVGIVPSEERRKNIPEDFPLTDGKLTCITCHRMRCQGEKENPLFLRGGPYKNRIETCLVCHVKDQYKKENPHDQVSEDGDIKEERCLFCHAAETDGDGGKKIGFKFKAPFRLYCVGCHPMEVERHPFGARHVERYIDSTWAGMSIGYRIKISQEQSFKITPVSLSGQIMCTSCHNPHDTRPGPKLRISDINKSCRQCHHKHYGGDEFSMEGPQMITEPSSKDMSPVGDDYQPFGYVASLRFYCIGCHPNKEKKHPYGIDHNGRFINRFYKNISKEKRVRLSQAETSQIIPLTTSGQVACFTCHDPHDGRKGPKLRLTEKDLLCSLCHVDRSMVIKTYKETKPPEKDILDLLLFINPLFFYLL